MTITIKSNTDTILELPGLPGTLAPGKTVNVQAITQDLVRAIDLGLLLVPSGAEPPMGLPPVIFNHRYPKALPITAGIDRLEGFHPSGHCLYHRVLAQVFMATSGRPTLSWVYISGTSKARNYGLNRITAWP